MKRHIEGIVVTIEPFDSDEHSFNLTLIAYVNGIKIEKSGMFFDDDKDFDDSFLHLFNHVKQTIREQIEKLDAINWDKDKIREMIKEQKENEA